MWRARFHEKSRLGPLIRSSVFLAVLGCVAGLAVAQEPPEKSTLTPFDAENPESPLVLPRALRIHKHRARLFAAEAPGVGPVDRRYEERLRSAVRKRRRALAQRTAPWVASLVEGRAPADARKAFEGGRS